MTDIFYIYISISKFLFFFLQSHLIIPNFLLGPENDYNGIPTQDSYKGRRCVYCIVSDYNNIFVLHKSEDINKNRLFQKLQLILILCLQVMHDYVHWHCSTDYSVKLSLGHETLVSDTRLYAKNGSNFIRNLYLLNP